MSKRRILFVVEAITQAQVVRSVVLAHSLDPSRFEVHFASGHFDEIVFAGTRFHRWPLTTIDADFAARALARGRRIYDARTLERYVEAELGLFDAIRPDVVVGDFRLSLAVSARSAAVPRVTLINGYWSPFARRDTWPLPDHPIVDWVGDSLAARYFPEAMPYAFSHFAEPVHHLLRKRRLPTVGGLTELLTDGDITLYLDVPELIPTGPLPSSHRFIGAVPWAPRVALPAGALADRGRPWVYVTLGSSGRADRLPMVLEALAPLPVDVLVATAGRPLAHPVPANVCVASFVPGDLVAGRVALVVSNGGSTTGYQALAAGTPVLGLPSNLDQALSSQAIDRAGAGRSIRAGAATVASLRDHAVALLEGASPREAARTLAGSFARYDCHLGFQRALYELASAKGRVA